MKFKFRDRVRIVTGFYEGSYGIVDHYVPEVLYPHKHVQKARYTVLIDGAPNINPSFYEEELEKINE